ncbi:MAG: PAS domain-containing protein [Gammaproteobacteria bacterium]|nr:PAS domain-containing protein [Gammaproteobacteria bacterium]
MDETANLPSHYIAIGASAGGLEAIDGFFKNMSPESGAAFIVIQHLSPDHKSLMTELLSKRTLMHVQRATEGMLVEADNVYLIPPNHDLRIFHGKLLLNEQDRERGFNLPIDIFFTSLAEDQGDKAIAIVLSGTGSDGTRGVRVIKERAGMVMVQTHESAAFDGMPRSAKATGVADFVLAPDEMPAQLISYMRHPYTTAANRSERLLTDENDLDRIFSLVREQSGVDFTFYKPNTVQRRIERRMTVNEVVDFKEYVRFMDSNPKEVDNLYRDLLIGVTHFFRDDQAFQYLADKCLPKLLENRVGKEMRIWVAGCSTGEEAYSLAILCSQAMERMGKLVNLKIFATDVDKEAVTIAGHGVYPESILADVPTELLAKYFYRREDGFQIARHIREMVVFAQHNIVKDPPFTNIDLISCRNMLIYFQTVLQQQVMEMFNFSLNDQGVLFLGSSETTGEMTEYFESIHHKWKIYRSKGRKPRHTLSKAANEFRSRMSTGKSADERAGGNRRIGTPEDESLLNRLLQSISDDYLPFILVINEEMELLHMVGDSTAYLRFPSGRMETHVAKLISKELAIPLANGVQKVLKEEGDINYSNIHLHTLEGSKIVAMRIHLLTTRKGQRPLIAIFIQEGSRIRRHEEEQQGSDTVQNYDIGLDAQQRISDLEHELQFSRENLQATVEELETSNEELQATNEELLASNEELQSTNEELQSVNEELYTVNAEYQDKIVELTEVNNDLDNLLNNIRIGTLFLDDNLEVRRFTADLTRVIRIIQYDIGRPFSHLVHDILDVNLLAMVTKVRDSNAMLEQEVTDRQGNSYILKIIPYSVGPKRFSGVLLTFYDISSSKQLQSDLKHGIQRLRLAQNAGHLGNWEWNIITGELEWSDSIIQLFGLGGQQLQITYERFLESVYPDDRALVSRAVNQAVHDPDYEYHVVHRVIWPNGTIRWMEESGQVFRDADGKPERMLGMVVDITKRKQAELILKQAADVFRSTLTHLDLFAVQLDVNGRIAFANDFLLRECGWSRDEVIGKDWCELFIPPEIRATIAQLFNQFIVGAVEIALRHNNEILTKRGARLLIHWNNTPVLDENGAPVGVSSIGQYLLNPSEDLQG